MSNKKAVVLLSGGIDSSTTAAIARAEGYEIYALSFDYAQRHRRELLSAGMVAESLGVKKHLVIGFDLRAIGGSALTSETEVPKAEDMSEGNGITEGLKEQRAGEIPVTYVPARNTIFLSFGLSWAEVLEAPDIFIGANAVDYSGYPDCRPEYLRAFEEMANLATKVSVEGKLRFRINAPLLYMTKAEIIRRGTELGLDYSLTWSCYDPREARPEERKTSSSPVHIPCGRCDSCLFRAKGFEEAGLEDPLLR
ncbi:MAG: 7-cyano-7-deazaguanine synthase QueC [Nitrospirales bacterium]|nr:7-cyano-7-deazaguanine synthase QueC [Nitrospirales bacterium]